MPESARPAGLAGATGPATALGFDFGTKRIGVAVGQKLTGTARPLQMIRLASHGEPWKSIGSLIDTWRPDALVVGFAYPFDSGQNPIAPAMDQFCRILERRFGIPVHRVDETLSTAEARSAFHAGPRRRERFLDVKDELAAAVILQTWLCDS